MKISVLFNFNKATKSDIERYCKEYVFFSKLTNRQKRKAGSHIKKFEELGIAVPIGLIQREYIK